MSAIKRAMNRFPEMLLRSPLHGLMKNTLLITFTGRKSGKTYTTPIVYLREGEEFLMTTDSPWWKNLRGGAPVILRIRGEEYPALGEAVTDEVEVARVLKRMLDEHPGYGKHVGLESGERADRARVEELARERVVIRARPAGADGTAANPPK